jgi:hypothetical protein
MDKDTHPPRDVSSLSDVSFQASSSGGSPRGEIAFTGGGPTKVPRYRLIHVLVALLAVGLYAGFVIPQWGEAYIDFGDGNYMYIASRIAEGAVVYRDILAPQPPMHLFVGAGLVKLHEAIRDSLPPALQNDHPILIFRAFSLLLQIATFLLVIRLGGRAWGMASAGIAAGVVYLLLPLNLWWGMAYQSEPLEIFFLLVMMNFALGGSRAGDTLAGVFGALAAMTNATAAPFLLILIIYMACVNWRRALRLAAPALILAGIMTALMEWYSGGTFLRTVVLDQAGTVPPDDTLNYILGKLEREGADILYHEGIFIIVGLLGLFRFIRVSPLQGEARGGLLWFSLATLLSFLYVAKGGTVDYIFSLAGPALAIMGAGLWAEVAPLTDADGTGPRSDSLWLRWVETGKPRFLAFLLLLLVFSPTMFFYRSLWNQSAFELPDLDHAAPLADGTPGPSVEQIEMWIDRYSDPGDLILAPPFYAVLADRDLWGDYSELFIWTIKDHNDRLEGNLEGQGHQKTLALAAALRNAELPLVIIEMAQTGRLPEIRKALNFAYRPLLEEPYPTLNTRLAIFIPRGEGGLDHAATPAELSPAGAGRSGQAAPPSAPVAPAALEPEAPADIAPVANADAPTSVTSPASLEATSDPPLEASPPVRLLGVRLDDDPTTTESLDSESPRTRETPADSDQPATATPETPADTDPPMP